MAAFNLKFPSWPVSLTLLIFTMSAVPVHGAAAPQLAIEYDDHKGSVQLSKNAWLSDGQTEIRGESLKYDVLAQSIVAESSDQGSQRVHIIITPPPSKP